MSLLQALYSYFFYPVLTLLMWVVIVNAILSWLVGFRVVNPQNQLISMIGRFTEAVTYPLVSPIRRVLPTLGGIDFSPFILILIIIFVRDWALPQLIGMLSGATVF
jgi:YggT family protein